jgi:hypothetical protein
MLRIDDIPQQVADAIHGFAVIQASPPFPGAFFMKKILQNNT